MNQQNLHSRSWSGHITNMYNQSRGNVMQVIGKVTGYVDIIDLRKRVSLNQLMTFTQVEFSKSSDLQNAIKRGWVEIVEDRGGFVKEFKTEVYQQPIAQQQNKQEMIEMAKAMAKEIAAEMMKQMISNPDYSKDLTEIKDSIKNIQVTNITNISDSKMPSLSKEAENTFIEIKDGDVKMEANIGEIGKTVSSETDVSSTLKKMRRFKTK